MSHCNLVHLIAAALLLAPSARSLAGDDAGPFVRSLWLVQSFGTTSVASCSA